MKWGDLFYAILNFLGHLFAPTEPKTVENATETSSATSTPPAVGPKLTPEVPSDPKPIPVSASEDSEPVSAYKFDTPQNARHSVRLICDEMLPLKRTVLVNGRYYLPKDVICACIEQESQFRNSAKNYNRNAAGKITSTDWGICQINDTPGWHIGPGLAFPSVEYVVAHPEEAVRYMIRMFKAGKLSLWVSYKSGAYERYLPQN